MLNRKDIEKELITFEFEMAFVFIKSNLDKA